MPIYNVRVDNLDTDYFWVRLKAPNEEAAETIALSHAHWPKDRSAGDTPNPRAKIGVALRVWDD